MEIETLDDLVEDLADKFGVYGAGPEGDHPDDCKCRICFTIGMKERIRSAVEVEKSVLVEGLANGWIQYKCRGCGGVGSALRDSLCGHYQICETCARKKLLGDSNMLPPGQVWLKEGSPGSGRYA